MTRARKDGRARKDSTICNGGEHQGDRIATGRDRQPTQRDPGNNR
jgi:hypothetical protein